MALLVYIRMRKVYKCPAKFQLGERQTDDLNVTGSISCPRIFVFLHTIFHAFFTHAQKIDPVKKWRTITTDSSVGRAGDCRLCSLSDISRSLVQIRLGGVFIVITRVIFLNNEKHTCTGS